MPSSTASPVYYLCDRRKLMRWNKNLEITVIILRIRSYGLGWFKGEKTICIEMDKNDYSKWDMAK